MEIAASGREGTLSVPHHGFISQCSTQKCKYIEPTSIPETGSELNFDDLLVEQRRMLNRMKSVPQVSSSVVLSRSFGGHDTAMCLSAGNSESDPRFLVRRRIGEGHQPVSYTHLTLPTSDLV